MSYLSDELVCGCSCEWLVIDVGYGNLESKMGIY